MAWAPPQVGQRKQDIITSIIYEGAERGWSDTYLASRLRDVLPLTDRQRTAVTVYRRSLRDQGIPPARAKMLVDRYTQRLKSQRAKTIARTERAKMETRSLHNTIGELPLEREWVSKSGCCIVCKALTGVRTSTVYGPGLPGPPAHPNCRCSEKIHKLTSRVTSGVYKAHDGDGDKWVLEGTPYERPWKPGDTPSYFLPDKSVEAKKFDDLPGDTPVVLFHGTSKAGVNRLIAGGRGRVAVGDSISDLTQGDGLYVAPTTKDAAFYVPKDDGEVVAIMTLKKHVIASPEAKRKTPGQALYDSFEGAMLQPDAPFTARLIRAIEKAHDGDGDMRVHDGTDAERPKGPMDTPKLGGRRARQQGTRERIKSLRAKAAAGSGFRAATDEDRKRLAIPPAWTDVEVSEDPEGVNGLLARGRDSKGRRQGRYSAAHTEAQAAAKFNRVKRIAPALPRFDRQLKKDALTNDNAGALTIIRRLGMRLGGEGETGADVKAYGANTLERRHVSIEGRKVTFDFIGKKGVHITITTSDPEVLRVVKSRLAKEGGDDDQLFPSSNVDSIRAYLRKTMPEETLVKDLRTIRANELALEAISGMGRAKTMTEYKKLRLQVGEIVSGQLGNNRSEALKSYINPTVFLMLLPEGVDPQP